MKLPILLLAALLTVSCNETTAALAEAASNGQTYTYTIKISATTSDYTLDVQTPTETQDTGQVTISGTQDQYIISGTSISGTVTRHNGPGHMSVVVLKDGVNVFTESITSSTGVKDLTGL